MTRSRHWLWLPALLILLYLLQETLWLRVTTLRVRAPMRLRLVQLTDLHGQTGFLNGRLADQVNRLHPDVVCVTGDLTNRPQELDGVLDELKRIRVPLYFVPGNWERKTVRPGQLRRTRLTEVEFGHQMKRISGVATVLLNRGELLGDLLLNGLDNSEDGREAYTLTRTSARWRMVLAHAPDAEGWLNAHHIPFDLLLTGHLHGGQVRPLARLVSRWRGPLSGAWRAGGDSNGLVVLSRGLGTSHLPLRLFSTPEIVLIELGEPDPNSL